MQTTSSLENLQDLQDYHSKLSNAGSTGQIIRINLTYKGDYQIKRQDYSFSKQTIIPIEFIFSTLSQRRSALYQCEFLIHTCGFNISQLATLLHVQRPTVYEWLAGNLPNTNNLERLEHVYSLFNEFPGNSNLRVGSYFYKKFNGQKSLHDLLIEKNINAELVKSYISKIQSILLENRVGKNKRDALMSEAGFRPVTQVQKMRTLRKLIRKA